MSSVSEQQKPSTAVPHENQASLNSPNPPFIRNTPTARPHLAMPIHTPDSTYPVRVACHRGDWRNYVENTVEAVESCIQMGADIVEVDVWRTKDGVLVLMHDETLERCTSGSGKICDHTLAEIRELRMKDGLGNMTEFTVPTAEEVLLLAKDRVVINLDKADLYLDEAYQLLVKTGMVEQTILKSDIPYDNLRKRYGEELLNKVIFMPIVNVTDATTYDEIDHIFAPRHDLYEINFEKENVAILQYIRKLAKDTGAVLWVNTIWPTTCGGHNDDHALRNKEVNWGYVADAIGAGIIQTDRPALLLDYLKARGSR
jgi:glycerophosphoryl diester phosphodiesterase